MNSTEQIAMLKSALDIEKILLSDQKKIVKKIKKEWKAAVRLEKYANDFDNSSESAIKQRNEWAAEDTLG